MYSDTDVTLHGFCRKPAKSVAGRIRSPAADYILFEKMTEDDPVAESFRIWLYQLDRGFIQEFEKVSVDLSLACELRATLLCAHVESLMEFGGSG